MAGVGAAPQRPRAVIWDVDGTLVKSTRMAFEASNTVLREVGQPEITEAQYLEGCIYPTPKRFAFHVSGDPEDPRGLDLAARFDALYVGQVSPDTVPLYPGIAELLGDLHAVGCRFGAVSNACTAYVEAVMSTHSCLAPFEQKLGADTVPAGKPSGSGLLQCCEAMGLAPSDCLYVGDAPTDGLAARAAGMRGVGVTWGANSREKLAPACDVVVDDVASLSAVLIAAPS